MAKQTIKKTKFRVKKGGASSGMVCNLCGGSGFQPKPYSKKKKK